MRWKERITSKVKEKKLNDEEVGAELDGED